MNNGKKHIEKLTEVDFIHYPSKFYIYDTVVSPSDKYTEHSILEFPEHLLTANNYINKLEAPAFIINNLKDNAIDRMKDSFEFANMVMIDIDFKNEDQKDQFKKEYNNYDNTISFDQNLDKFMVDCSKLAWITARSFSKNGIHIFFYFNCIDKNGNDILLEEEGIFTVEDLHKSNYKVAEKLIVDKTGYKLNDKCGLVLTQPTLPCWKDTAIINNIFYNKVFEVEIDNKKFTNDITREDCIKLNNKLNLNKYTKSLIENLSKISLQNYHYEDVLPFFSALHLINDENIRYIFYSFIKKHYKGSSLNWELKSIDNFNKYINKLNFSKYNVPFKYILNNLNIYLTNDNDKNDREDFYGRNFEHTYSYNNYLTKFNVENEDAIINAPTGAGKTTVAMKFLSSKKGVNVFVCPTVVIADQTYQSCKDNKNIIVKKCYDGFFDKYNGGDCVYICVIQALFKLKDLKINCAIYDECHSLISYEIFNEANHNKPYFLPDAAQKLFISATPDQYKCFDNNLKYIKYNNDNMVKRNINIQHYKSHKKRLDIIISTMKKNPNKNYIIFHNNKNENIKILETLTKEGLIFSLVDADNKEEAYKKLIEENIAENLIVTSLINDGVNINNIVDGVFILDNHTQNIENLYQLCNRFRKCDPKFFLLRLCRSNKNNSKDENYRSIKIYDLIQQKYNFKISKLEKDVIEYNNSNHCYKIEAGDGNTIDVELDKITDDKYIYKKDKLYFINKKLVMYKIINDINREIWNNPLDFNYYMKYYFKINYIKNNYDDTSNLDVEIKEKDAKDLYFKYYNNIKDLEKCEGDERYIYATFKNKFKVWNKRYLDITTMEKKAFDNIKFNMEKITGKDNIYQADRESFALKIKKYLNNINLGLEKCDLMDVEDHNKIIDVLENIKTIDEFIVAIQNVKLLEKNKIDLTDMKSINKCIKKDGYRFRFMKGKIRLEKY